jgi:hypothetical protein
MMVAPVTVERDGSLHYLTAEAFVIGIGTVDDQRKVCHIQFSRDGSIYVSPIFNRQPGLLSEVSYEKDPTMGATVDLTVGGKLASHVAKLTHHASGEAGFSQTGKLTRKVYRQSFPLANGSGKVFDLKAFNLSAYKRLDGKDNPKRAYIRFQFQDSMPGAVVLTGYWLRKKDFLADIKEAGPIIGPPLRIRTAGSSGSEFRFLIGQPAGYPFREHLLMLGVSRGSPGTTSSPAMILVGGWDHPEPEHGRVGAIAWLYPFTPTAEQSIRLESINWPPVPAP